MKPNPYAPNANPGDSRLRIWRVGGENPNALAGGGAPSMVFNEEEAARLADGPEGQVREVSAGRTADLPLAYAPARLVPLKDPRTDADLGQSVTMEYAFAIMYALGRLAQADRDARPPLPDPVEVLPPAPVDEAAP